MSKSQKTKAVQDPTRVPTNLERISFIGVHIPDEVKVLVPALHSLAPAQLLTVAAKVLEGIKSCEIDDSKFIALQGSVGLQNGGEIFGIIYTGITVVMLAAIRKRIKLSIFNKDLLLLNFPSASVDILTEALKSTRTDLYMALSENSCKFPTVSKLRWRIDVTISSGSLTRVMRPSIMMQLILCNGEVKTFDVSIEQFNQLRYGVAKVLNDMQNLERHPIMKIVNEFKSRDEDDMTK